MDSWTHLFTFYPTFRDHPLHPRPQGGPRRLTKHQILEKERAARGCNGRRCSRQRRWLRRGLKPELNTAELAPAGGGAVFISPQPLNHSSNTCFCCTYSEASSGPVAQNTEGLGPRWSQKSLSFGRTQAGGLRTQKALPASG